MSADRKIRVIIESPYAANERTTVIQNRGYARAALLDSLTRGEAPIASHLLYTQVLNDQVPLERTMGIEAGLAWGQVAELTAVYADLGITPGMQKGIDRATSEGRTVEIRYLLRAGGGDDAG